MEPGSRRRNRRDPQRCKARADRTRPGSPAGHRHDGGGEGDLGHMSGWWGCHGGGGTQKEEDILGERFNSVWE